MQQKLLFYESRHEHVSSQSTSLTACQRVIFKIYIFVFHFSDGTLAPYLSSRLSVYSPSHTLQSNSYEKHTLSCTRWKLKGFGYQLFPVQARGLEQPSCSHPRLQFSLTVQNFTWNLPLYFCLLWDILTLSQEFEAVPEFLGAGSKGSPYCVFVYVPVWMRGRVRDRVRYVMHY